MSRDETLYLADIQECCEQVKIILNEKSAGYIASGFQLSYLQPSTQRRVNDRMPNSRIFGGFEGFGLVVVEVHSFTRDKRR